MKRLPRNGELLENARRLRREMTKEEKILWYQYLRTCSPRFTRQKIIGSYIVDFYCNNAKLVIELDGSQHYEAQGIIADRKRTAYLESLGLTVVRFSNLDILQHFDGVCQAIDAHLKTSP